LRARYYYSSKGLKKSFIEGGFSLYQYVISYGRFGKKFLTDLDYNNQKYAFNFSIGKEWGSRDNRKLAFQLIARFQLNESLDANLSSKSSHRYNHIGFEMRHSF